MKRLTRPQLAWSLWALSLVLSAAFIGLVVAGRGSPGPLEYDEAPLIAALYVLLMLIFPTVGAPVAARHPSNAIGWLFCGTGVAMAAGFCAQLYADYALFNDPGALPGGELAAWASTWLLPFGLFVTPIFLLFLFPNGRPATARWRVVVRVGVALVAVGLVGAMLEPGRVEPFPGLQNPLGLPGAAGRVMGVISEAFALSAIPYLLAGAASMVSRMRRSTGDVRQQLKWFAYVSSVMGVCFALAFVFSAAGRSGLADVLFVVGAVALISLPIASGLAILKYRLYDIDRIINRTLVYGPLTAVLALVYAAGVVGGGGLVREATGQVESDLLIAASTLAVAALFRPARTRIQSFIDRAFYRSRYDAAQTLEIFASRLREEVDLEALQAELLGVVQQTMEPAHVSLWLRADGIKMRPATPPPP